jgi:hypothetical protein
VATLTPLVVDQGTAFPCPAGWTCPVQWDPDLLGQLDAAFNQRQHGQVDLGAYEQ